MNEHPVIAEIESILSKLIASGKLPQGKLNKYHWDAIDITLHWVGDDGIERNLQLWYKNDHDYTESSLPGSIVILGAAWRDDRSTLTRRWNGGMTFHPEIRVRSPEDIAKKSKTILRRILAAYKEVQAITQENLIYTSPLQPFPGGKK